MLINLKAHRLETNRLDVRYDGLKAVILGMVNITDGLPWPLKAVPQTVLQVIYQLENGKAGTAHIARLLGEIMSWWELVAKFGKQDSNNEQLREEVETFFGNVHGILIRLHVLQAVHPIKQFIAGTSIDSVLEEETAKLSTSTARFLLAQVLSTSNTAERTIALVTEVQSTLATVATAVESAISTSTSSAVNVGISVVPPARPRFFYGRSQSVRVIVDAILKLCPTDSPARIAILGAGGIGKTSLSLAILHDPEIASAFDTRRFFLSCESCADANAVAVALAKLFSIAISPDVVAAVSSYLTSQQCTFLILDNVETVWLATDSRIRNQFEQFLGQLAFIPTLTLVITSRGMVLPPNISWSNETESVLEPFDLEAARATFIAVARDPMDDAENNALTELLQAVDCMPLAVALLARLGQRHNRPSALLERWKLSRTAMLQTHSSGRDASVAVSISISIDLLCSASSDEEPLHLLSICAQLPDGLRMPTFELLEPYFQNLGIARQAVIDYALVTVGDADELKMLSPVRHFVDVNYPVTADHLAALRRIYFNIAAMAPQQPADDFTLRSAQITPEYGNLSSFLLRLIQTEQPSQELFDSVLATSQYSFLIAPSLTLLETLRTSLSDQPAWLSACVFRIGRMKCALSEVAEAAASFQDAQDLYESIGDSHMSTWCASWLAECLRLQGMHDAAELQLIAVLNAFVSAKNELGITCCNRELGRIYIDCGRYEEATHHLVAALEFYEERKMQFYAAQCRNFLATIHLFQNDYIAAENELHAARLAFENLGDRLGVAICTGAFGRLSRLKQNYELAETQLLAAQHIFKQFSSPTSHAFTLYELGMLRLDQQRSQDARDFLYSAQTAFTRLNDLVWVNYCDLGLARARKQLQDGDSAESASTVSTS
ncbi:hypothetical protein BKA62DRAFT_23781 [Auriculariales sp. MPI-PUGE-AT-0066]|nr:hypothetical protein BKA62DRAFT_23781 [Auriculariales sp. MPI-PUGE-AT-0066]